MPRFAAILLILALLAACGGTAEPPGNTPLTPQPGVTPAVPGTDNGKTVISFGVWEYEVALYRPLAERFSSENPDIEVVIVPIDEIFNSVGEMQSPTSMLRRLVALVDTSSAFSVSPEAFNTPLLLNMQPLIDADTNFNRGDFYPGALERWSTDAGTWVLPRYFYIPLFNYNRELIQAGGEPDIGSWSDLLALAEQSTIGSGPNVSVYGWVDTSSGLFPFAALLERRGMNPFAISPDELDMTAPEYVEILEELRRLYRDGVIYNAYNVMHSEPIEPGIGIPLPVTDPSQVVREGRAAIWGDIYIAGPEGEPIELPFERRALAFPSSSITDSFVSTGGDGYIISGGTAAPTASWRWIEWLSRQNTDQAGGWYGGGAIGRVPARQSLAEQLGYWEQIDDNTAGVLREVIARGTPILSRTPDYLVQGAFMQAISQVTNDRNADPRQVLAEAQRQLIEQRNQMLLTPTPTPDVRPVIVATPEPQDAPAGATTITVAAYGYSTSNLRPIIRAFREQRPDIYINVINPEFVNYPTIGELAATADCFFWGDPLQGSEDLSNLLDLQPLIDADPTFPIDDYPPALVSAFQREGRTIGLPIAYTLRTLNYNRTLLDEVGARAPQGTWTPADFLEAAKAYAAGSGDQQRYGYASLSGVPQDLIFWATQFDTMLVTGSGQDVRPNFDDPNVVRAIQWYLDLSRVHQVMPEISLPYRPSDPYEDRSYEYVQSGRVGMWFDYGYSYFGGGFGEGGQPSPAPFEVGVAPLPVGGAGLSASDLSARGMFISAGTQHPEACWEWMKFFSNDLTLLYGSLPARRSVAESEAFSAVSSPEMRQVYDVYRDTLARPVQARGSMYALYSSQIDTFWLFRAIMNSYKEGADLATELAEAQRFSLAFAECVSAGESPVVCAPRVDPTYDGYNVGELPRG